MHEPTSPISLTEAAERLGVHYMTAYRYVRTGRLPARKVGQEWRVEQADVDAFLAAASTNVVAVGRGRRRERTSGLVDRLTRSDEQGAWAIIDDAVAGGMDPDQVVLDMIGPALVDVGDRWARGEVSVAQEHQASALVLRIMGRLGPRFVRRGRKRGTIVIGSVPGDVHGLPSALLGDLLRGRGFDVVDLGADVPAESWASTCQEVAGPLALGLCATTPGNDAAIARTTAAIRAVTDAPIVLGGNAVTDDRVALELGASARSASFAAALDLFDGFAGAARPSTSSPSAS